jgi:hypothetical protein
MIQLLWDVLLCHWACGSDVLKEHGTVFVNKQSKKTAWTAYP